MTAPQEQRGKVRGAVVITANRLWDGKVVYRTPGNGWSTELAAAAVVTNPDEAERLLQDARADERDAVGAYLAPVAQDSGAPANLRERIRCNGPTILLPSVCTM